MYHTVISATSRAYQPQDTTSYVQRMTLLYDFAGTDRDWCSAGLKIRFYGYEISVEIRLFDILGFYNISIYF